MSEYDPSRFKLQTPRSDVLAMPVSHRMVGLLNWKIGDKVNMQDLDTRAAVAQAARILRNARFAVQDMTKHGSDERKAAISDLSMLVDQGGKK